MTGGHCISTGGNAGGGILNGGEGAVVVVEVGDGVAVPVALPRQSALGIIGILYTITIAPVALRGCPLRELGMRDYVSGG